MNTKDVFLKLCNKDAFYTDQHKRCYALVDVNDHKEVMFIDGTDYENLVEYRLYRHLQKEGEAPSKATIKSIVDLAKFEAKYKGIQKPLHKRVAEDSGSFYYDMTNEKWGVIRIQPGKWRYGHTSRILFERCQTQAAQVMPAKNGAFNKLDTYLKNVLEPQQLLVKVHVIASLIPNISHAALIIQSEKGSGKTTLTQMLKSIIDPGGPYPLQLNAKELTLNLHSNYLANFDNLSHISSSTSDIFCRAVTGATDNKRKLYTDTDQVIMEYKNCLLLNGISLGTLKDDLLDRSILIKLKKPNPQEILSDTEYWGRFTQDLPDILGGAFTTLSEAMHLYNSDCPKSSFRLIDYADWGYAIAEAIGGMGQQYLKALKQNHMDKNNELIESNAICLAVKAFMKDRDIWKGRPSVLLTALDSIALKMRLGPNLPLWPKSAIELSHQLKSAASLLAEGGIIIEKGKHTNKGSTWIIHKL